MRWAWTAGPATQTASQGEGKGGGRADPTTNDATRLVEGTDKPDPHARPTLARFGGPSISAVALVQPARLQLALLDPQLRDDLRLVWLTTDEGVRTDG